MPKHKQKLTATDSFFRGHSRAKMADFARWERMMTFYTGGLFPEPSDLPPFHHILDIGCGSGSWAIKVAQTDPTLSLEGIDIDAYIVDYARSEAETAQVSERVQFHLMDALQPLDFPDASFDLVNLGLGSSFVRTWEWPPLLREIRRITRPKGVIRLVEMEPISQSKSTALVQFGQLVAHSFFLSGHFFDSEVTGLTAHLEGLLRDQRYQHIQTKEIQTVFRVNAENQQTTSAMMSFLFPSMQFFLQKWKGEGQKEYADLCQQALTDIQQETDYSVELHFFLIWGIKEDGQSFNGFERRALPHD